MHLDVGAPAAGPDLDRLVGELDRRPDRHQWEETLDVLGIEPRAAVAHLHAHTPRDVGPVDRVERAAELDAVLAEGIVGRAAADEATRVVALLDVLAADRLGDVPLRIDGLAGDVEPAARGSPVVAPEPDRVGVDRRQLRVLLAALVVVEPHLGDVDHDPLVAAAGQDPFRRQHDRGSGARDPGVDARVRVDDLVVAEVVETRDVEQRVAGPDGVARARPDHGLRRPALARHLERIRGDLLLREGRLVVLGGRDRFLGRRCRMACGATAERRTEQRDGAEKKNAEAARRPRRLAHLACAL